jgi:iron complex transport system permease protein
VTALSLRRASRLFPLLGALLTLGLLANLMLGAVAITPLELLGVLTRGLGAAISGDTARVDALQRAVVLEVRLPRLLLGAIVGAALGLSGALMQGLFRNPLADPGLIGVSSGAVLGATSIIVVGSVVGLSPEASSWTLPLAAFSGAVAVTLIVWRLSRRGAHTDVRTLLLAGIAINALVAAVIGVLVLVATDVQLRSIQFWSLGSLGSASYSQLALAVPLIGLALGAVPLLAGPLNVLLLGEDEARCLGVRVERIKRLTVASACLAVGVAVALTGTIGFIGLVAPHLVRLLTGPDHRRVLPGAAVLGACLVVLADLGARTLIAPAELPIGIVTAVLGAPFFLWLLRRRTLEAGA